MTDVHPSSLARFVRSIAILALPARDQVDWLRSLGLGEPGFADELAMEFDDGMKLLWHFNGERWLSEETQELAKVIDRIMSEKSGSADQDFWRVDSLQSPIWQQVRELARAALYSV